MQMTPEQAAAAIKKYGTATKAAKALGMIRSTLQRAADKAGKTKEPAPSKGKSLKEFRELYDKSYYVPNKVRAALAKLGSSWEYEIDFSRNSGISLSDLHAVREQFIDYIVQIGRDGRRAWSGSKAVAEQMRKMV